MPAEIWTGRTPAARIMGGAAGAALGSALALVLVFWAVPSVWLVAPPIAVGAVAGFWKGDRALLAMLRLIGKL